MIYSTINTSINQQFLSNATTLNPSNFSQAAVTFSATVKNNKICFSPTYQVSKSFDSVMGPCIDNITLVTASSANNATNSITSNSTINSTANSTVGNPTNSTNFTTNYTTSNIDGKSITN